MIVDDLIIIAAILGLALLAAWLRLFARRRRSLMVTGESYSEETSAGIVGMSDGVIGGESLIERDQDIIITFSDSGMQYRWIATNESLLEFIESRGIEVDCLCRAGECGSCRTKIIAGEVEYHTEPAIYPGDGYCLLCVSTPKSDLVLAK